MVENSPLDVDYEDLIGLELEKEETSLDSGEIGRLTVRTLTVLLVIVGSIVLVVTVFRRGRGSWKEVVGFCLVQLVWQGMAWYSKHIDSNWVHSLDCLNVDCEHSRKIYVFVENLFHGVAVYSAVALVGRLDGLVGVLLWILGIMSAAAPLLFAVVILLLDLTLTYEKRSDDATEIGVAIGKTVWFNVIPSGLLLCWFMGQCLNGFTRLRSSSSRETASKLIAAFLLVFHVVHLAGIVVYVVAKSYSVTTQITLAPAISWLIEVGHLIAAIAVPCCWLTGLLLPRRGDSGVDPTEMNLKLAKQNKNRNIVKYRKEKSVVATPPATPFKFKPEVTSSPSVYSQETTGTIMSPTGSILSPAAEAALKKSKRSSYLEAVSSGSLNMEPLDPLPKSKSVEPLWLPSAARSLQV